MPVLLWGFQCKGLFPSWVLFRAWTKSLSLGLPEASSMTQRLWERGQVSSPVSWGRGVTADSTGPMGLL